MAKIKDSDQLSEGEARQRFESLVRSALTTPPKPLKSMAPKGVPAQSKKKANNPQAAGRK